MYFWPFFMIPNSYMLDYMYFAHVHYHQVVGCTDPQSTDQWESQQYLHRNVIKCVYSHDSQVLSF